MIEYKDINLKKWTVLAPVCEEIISNVVLVHVFGHEAESAFLVTLNDEVFALGENVVGRLGIGSTEILSAHKPVKLDALCGKQVICFCTGSVHGLALTRTGEVYSWGSNLSGQIGHESVNNQEYPKKITFPNNVSIKQITTGDRYSLALSTNNELYHWGDVEWNCCSKQSVPVLLNTDQIQKVAMICCGGFHAAVLSDDGKVFTWGVNETGQLGHGNTTPLELPKRVRGQLEDQVVVKIACSSVATLALTEEGILYAWGQNLNSSLAVGLSIENVCFPQRVIFRKNIVEIAANNLNFTLVAEAENPHEVFIWNIDDGESVQVNPVSLPGSNILEAFSGLAMPIVLRKGAASAMPFVPPLKGAPRDVGKVLFNVKEFSDLQIELADGIVYVHTVIMRTFCEHFKTLLGENWSKGRGNSGCWSKVLAWLSPKNTVRSWIRHLYQRRPPRPLMACCGSVNMTQYNAKAYRTFLKYIYTGVVEPLEGPEIIALYDIGMSYLEPELKFLCHKMFNYCLNISNVAQLYAIAANSQSELVESCIHFVCEHFDAVILSDGFEALHPVQCKSLVTNVVKYRTSFFSNYSFKLK